MKNPLADKDFLKQLDNNRNKEVFAKVIALTWDELPIEEIQGSVTAGSVNIDGTSAVRRTCSLTLVTKDVNINDYYWSVKTKFSLEIGIKNTVNTTDYPDIIWFPQGIYVINSFNTTYNTNSYQISISGKDKMCLLNGELGGTFQWSTDFGTEEYEDLENETVTITDIPIHKIIYNLLEVYGNENSVNIIINDLEDYGLELLQYIGDKPFYMLRDADSDIFTNTTTKGDMQFYLDKACTLPVTLATIPNYDSRVREIADETSVDDPTDIYLKRNVSDTDPLHYIVAKIEYGETVGYRLTDLTYAGELIANVGETITSVLDKIVSMLGNFEYYYSIDGKFIFEEKKNYINTSWSPLAESNGEMYVENSSYVSDTVYNFDNTTLITSFQNTPALNNVKNDYSAWGNRTSASGADIPVHMRLAIDKKPTQYKAYDGFVYTTDTTIKQRIYQVVKERETIRIKNKINSFTPMYPLPVGLPAPERLEDGSFTPGWWDIRDWYNYYHMITDEIPLGTMKWYSSNDMQGCMNIGTLHALGAHIGNTDEDEGYVWLLEGSLTGELNTQHNNTWEDVASGGRECQYYESVLNEDGSYSGREIIITESDKVEVKKFFYAPYSGCADTHTYFALLNEGYGHNVYFYNPVFPFKESTISAIINNEVEEKMLDYTGFDNFKLSDWREIIYRMAKDYYRHHEEEDFKSHIALNNRDYFTGDSLFPNGNTGYEQYYIDIEGFWRQLYNPAPKPVLDEDIKTEFLSLFKKTTKEEKDAAYIQIKNILLDNEEETEDDEQRHFYLYTRDDLDYITYADFTYGPKEGEQYFYWDYVNKCYLEPDFDVITYRDKYATYKAQSITCYVQNAAKNGYREVYDSDLDAEGRFKKGTKYYTKDSDGNYNTINIYKFNRTDYPNRIYESDEFNIYTHWCTMLQTSPDTLNFWFDFIDNDSDLWQYSVPSIGSRTKAINESTITAIYFKETPDILFCTNDEINNLSDIKTGYVYINLPQSMTNLFSMSGQGKSAKDAIDSLLYQYSYCVNSINFSAIPIYYLEPNNIIHIQDDNTGISGDYLVSKISLPLGHNGTMSVTATKVVNRLY